MDQKFLERTQKNNLEAVKIAFSLLDNHKVGVIQPERVAEIDDSHREERYLEIETADYISEYKKFDKDGLVDLEEFYGLVQETINDKKLLKEGLEIAFKEFDRDSTKLINPLDFKVLMESFGEKLTDEELKTMINMICVQNKDLISLDDFTAMTEFEILNKFTK